MSISRSIGVQLAVFACANIQVVLLDTPGISRYPITFILLSSHLCVIIDFISDLFVARNNSWTS